MSGIDSFKINHINISNYLILAYVFLLPLSLDGLRVIATLMIIMWIFDTNRFSVSIPKPFRIFIVFIVFSLLSYTWGRSDFSEVLEYVRRYWYFFPAFFIFKYITIKNISMTISIFLLSMFFSEVISYGIFFELIDPIGKSSIKNPTPFMHHTSYSVFLAITSIILLNRILITDDYKLKFLFFLFFLSVTTNLFINSGRTGQIAFILTLFIVLFYVVRLNVKNVLLLSFSVFSIALTAYNFSPNFNDRMNETKNDIEKVVIHSKYNSNLGVRAGFWIISREILKESPVLGVGVSSHIDYLNRKARSNFSHLKASGRFEHFHSQYLNIFAQLGILGLLIYGYFLFSIANIKVLNQEVNVFKIGLMSVFLLGFFVDTLLRFNIDIMLFSFMLGVVLAQNKFESNA